MEHVVVEGGVPLGIAKERVKLAQGWVCPLVAPGEPPILEVDFFKLTTIESCTEPVDSTGVNVPLVFIPCPINLVEIPGGDPSHPNGWLLANELGKEHIFERVVVGP